MATRQLDKALCEALAGLAGPRLNDFNARKLAHTAWAFAMMGQLTQALSVAMARPTAAEPFFDAA